MSTPALCVFGETTRNTTNSKYTFANAVTLAMLELLGDDPRFLDCNQADMLNLALSILNGFIPHPDKSKEEQKQVLHKILDDDVEFKNFALHIINYSRRENDVENKSIELTIEKGAI